MPTRIVTARPPKRIRKPAKTGPKPSRVIVGKRAPEPKTPEAHQARGDAAERLWLEMVASVSRKKSPRPGGGEGGSLRVETRRRNREKKPPSETDV